MVGAQQTVAGTPVFSLRYLFHVVVLVCRFPGLLENIFRPPSSGPGLQAYISFYNSIWLFVFVCVAYGVVSDPLPKPPQLYSHHTCMFFADNRLLLS